jgi:hypothetical protein
MKKMSFLNVIITFTLFIALTLGTCTGAFGYGDGGGGGGSDSGGNKNENSDDAANVEITKLSDSEVEKIFNLIGGKEGEDLSNIFKGTDLTQRELMEIRQGILEGNMNQENFNADLMNALTITVECLDTAGQVSQFGLSFVPGVGWVAAGLLDTARGGADAYRDGKSVKEILSEAAIAGATSVTINKLSPLGADKTFNNAKSAFNMLTKGSGNYTGKAVKVFTKNITKYGLKKEVERRTGDAMKNALNNASKKTPNRVSRPSYTTPYMGPGGFDVTPTGQKMYK